MRFKLFFGRYFPCLNAVQVDFPTRSCLPRQGGDRLDGSMQVPAEEFKGPGV